MATKGRGGGGDKQGGIGGGIHCVVVWGAALCSFLSCAVLFMAVTMSVLLLLLVLVLLLVLQDAWVPELLNSCLLLYAWRVGFNYKMIINLSGTVINSSTALEDLDRMITQSEGQQVGRGLGCV